MVVLVLALRAFLVNLARGTIVLFVGSKVLATTTSMSLVWRVLMAMFFLVVRGRAVMGNILRIGVLFGLLSQMFGLHLLLFVVIAVVSLAAASSTTRAVVASLRSLGDFASRLLACVCFVVLRSFVEVAFVPTSALSIPVILILVIARLVELPTTSSVALVSAATESCVGRAVVIVLALLLSLVRDGSQSRITLVFFGKVLIRFLGSRESWFSRLELDACLPFSFTFVDLFALVVVLRAVVFLRPVRLLIVPIVPVGLFFFRTTFFGGHGLIGAVVCPELQLFILLFAFSCLLCFLALFLFVVKRGMLIAPLDEDRLILDVENPRNTLARDAGFLGVDLPIASDRHLLVLDRERALYLILHARISAYQGIEYNIFRAVGAQLLG